MNPLRTIGTWLVRQIVADDPNPEPSSCEPTEARRRADIDSAVHANRKLCGAPHDHPAKPGSFCVCTLDPEHVGPHESRAAGATKPRYVWADADDARRDAWLKVIGATDPDTPVYHEALADWEVAREYEAKRTSYREAPQMVAEIEAVLAEEAAR